MSKQKILQLPYTVRVCNEPEASGVLRFQFWPKSLQNIQPAKRVPDTEYIVLAREHADELALAWVEPPPDEMTKAELEEVARKRFTERAAWIRRVSDLVNAVEGWAEELGWVTKRIEKKIEDTRLGNHKAAGLVMQQDAVRVLLEPISATAPGSDGLVDLCLMPGYDDVASLYHQHGSWHLHYVFPTQKKAANIKENKTRRLSKKALADVLDELKKHAE